MNDRMLPLGIFIGMLWFASVYMACMLTFSNPVLGGRMWFWRKNPDTILQTAHIISIILTIGIPIFVLLFID